MAKNKNHHLQKRDKVWYFVSMVRGERVRKALSTSITEARKQRDEYLEELRINGSVARTEPNLDCILFGEVATKWAKHKVKRVKSSSWRDYRSIMNKHILPQFGSKPIKEITCDDVEDFIDELVCGNKRKNNILVPMRSIFKYALKRNIIDRNIMLDVENLTPEDTEIKPLAIDEVRKVVEQVHPCFGHFFTVAFFTGMRFGEMAVLKWRNVELERGIIHVVETRVYGEEGSPKTKKSRRDIELLPPVVEALELQQQLTGRDEYVFRDAEGRLLVPDHVREHIWKPALEKAEIEYRPMLQTRHTFATMMIDAGEDIGWVQNQLGHASLQMIMTRYYSWVKKDTRSDGSAFMKEMYEKSFREKKPALPQSGKLVNFTPILPQHKKRVSTKSAETLVFIGSGDRI